MIVPIKKYPLVICYSSLLKMTPVEIVDLPSYKMVDRSIVFCMFTRGYNELFICPPTYGVVSKQDSHTSNESASCPSPWFPYQIHDSPYGWSHGFLRSKNISHCIPMNYISSVMKSQHQTIYMTSVVVANHILYH